MALFKCKMCGGSLEIAAGTTVIECEYCGTQQTLPKLDDEKRATLYDRANHYRRNNEFDKAMGIYEQILNEDNTDAEAYWSIVLCRYGIEYVEDPSTKIRVPTVNRAQFTSIFDDNNYKSALQYADSYQRSVYENEAREINEIQKGILAISQKEEPFDVFICYKETDNNGRRTPDSVLAQELYFGLKNEGFKVFFSRITLEDKLGSAYEPYIFAALNSAKVMVVLGTKPEFFNAVWVKNEWSRYLTLIKGGAKKMLIPAYKDMDPYDLPDEFSHLQAQDMSKLGFMQDLIRGIKKIAGKEKKEPVKETVIVNQVNQDHDTAPLLRRAYLFLEDGDFDSADEYAEKVLDINPECSDAYIVKLLIDLEMRSVSQITSYPTTIDRNPNYIKALRFAKGDERNKIEGYNQAIVDRIELDNKKQQYTNACSLMNARKYDEAISAFSKIKTFKDSADKIEACKQHKETDRKEGIYAAALRDVASTSADDKAIKKSMAAFQSIKGYKDADAWVVNLEHRLEKWYAAKKAAEEQARIKAEQDRLEAIRQAELRKIRAEQNKKKAKKIAKVAIPSLIALVLVIVLMVTLIIPMIRFNQADKLFAKGKYDEANSIYHDLGGFGDSNQRILAIKAIDQINDAKVEDAIDTLLSAGIPVELTYKTEGGSFDSALTLMAGLTLSADNSIVPISVGELPVTTLSARSGADNVVSLTDESQFNGFEKPYRNGYRFLEWVLDTYAYDIEAKDAKFCLTVMAKWSAKDYTIKYDLAGGVLDGENIDEYDPDDKAITLINPTKVGYTFAGWTGNNLSEPTVDVMIPSGSYGDRKYTATWKANEYTITYDANGGTVEETQTATYDADVTLLIPERRGYMFLGWYDGTTKYEDCTWTITNDVTLTAKWETIPYAIGYVMNGGSNSDRNPTTYTVATDDITLIAPTRTGYNFIGWTCEGQNTPIVELTIPKGSIESKTFTANWEAISSTITLDANGGNCDVTTLDVAYDAEFTLPTPTWEGNTFSGWYDGGTKVTSGVCDFVTDRTLVAKWNAVEYTITYTMNGGTNALSNPKTYNRYDAITLAQPSRTGYTFLGWTYSGQTTPTKNVTIAVGTMGNKTYTANWQANTYTVTFDANGGTVTPATLDATYDTNVTLPAPERTGYTFDGWFVGSTPYTTGAWKTAYNVTLVAKWKANTYKATYDANGGSVSSSYKNYTYDASYILLEPEKTGYEFLGWYKDGTLVPSTGTWKFDTDISLVAEWKARVYTVTYDAGVGTPSTPSSEATYDYNFTLATAERVGYTFDGWYCGETPYSDGVWTTADNITLTAKWIARTDISYVVNHYQQNANDDGYTKESTENLTGTADASVTPTVKTFDHFVSPTVQTVTIAPDGSLVVDYCYDRVTYNLTYVTNGGDAIETQSYKYDQTLVIATPTRTDYTFGGWFTDATLGTAYTATAMSDEDTTIYAYWTEENKPTDFRYIYKETGTIDVGAYSDNKYSMWVPAYIGGVPVTSIGSFDYCTRLSSITIPDTVTSINEFAFKNCTGLSSITIPDSVTSIGSSAFKFCSGLRSVTIGNSVISIGKNAFYGCSGLTSITIPNSVTSIDASTFAYCTNLTNITIGNGVTSIGENAFYICEALTSITIPDSVVSIGAKAFYQCSGLTSITIPESVVSIGEKAFYGCTGLTEINFNATDMNDLYSSSNAFYGAGRNGSGITVNIGANVTKIPAHLFHAIANDSGSILSPNITSIIFDDRSVCESIGSYAFYDCITLTSVTIPNGVTSIGDHAFYYTALTSITIPDSVTSIGDYAFYQCYKLTSITIGNSVTNIGKQAFMSCSRLTSITFNGTIAQWNAISKGNVWDGNTGKYTIYCTDGQIAKDGTISPYFLYTANEDGTTCTITDWVTTMITEFVIPEELDGRKVTAIGPNAFADCTTLTRVTIPDNVVSIGEEAFYNCTSLTSITIPSSVTRIDEKAFGGCTGLKSIVIPDNVQVICESILVGCTSLEKITIPVSPLSSNWHGFLELFGGFALATVPTSLHEVEVIGEGELGEYMFAGITNVNKIILSEGITTIEKCAFAYSSLQVVFIPSSVVEISADAFQDCRTLQTIHYAGTMASWKRTEFSMLGSTYWFEEDFVIYCADGQISKDGTMTPYFLPYFLYTDNEDGTTCTITGLIAPMITEIVIPEELDGLKVSAIGNNAFADCTTLTSVTIPDSVVNIGEKAFYSCTGLTEINFNATDMNDLYSSSNAFYGAGRNGSGITVNIGANVTKIPAHLFHTIANDSGSLLQPNITSIIFDDGSVCSRISNNAFENCASLTSITIPDSVTSIGDRAFAYCGRLTNITIGNGVTSIGEMAFYDCTDLTNVTIGDSVTRIGEKAFYNCKRLSSITFNGTKAEWEAIGKSYYWNTLVPATKVICSDGEVVL